MSNYTPSDQQFVYQVDRDDHVVFCDRAWLRFADANGAPELDSPGVLGRPLWDFIATSEARSLYAMLMAKARQSQHPVAVSFRCDGPTCRRTMRLEIAPADDEALTFTSVLQEEAPRPYVALLDAAAPRGDDLLMMCSWCKQVLVDGAGWLEVEEAAEALQLFERLSLPQISHGVCDRCYDAVVAALE